VKLELIQPFINAADTVLAEILNGPAQVTDVSMQEEVYRRKGVAASVGITGDIEGRVIFDLDQSMVLTVAKALMGGAEVDPSDEFAGEAACELANMVVGNAITLLNDQGFRFRVAPPEKHTSQLGCVGTPSSEALVMCFVTSSGEVHMNIALDYSRTLMAAALANQQEA
jgi:chemotaxis protein CheX